MATLKQQLEVFDATGDFLNWDGEICKFCNFWDWFCEDSELENRAIKLYGKVNEIAKSKKIDLKTTYVTFKNNWCTDYYDDFRIFDIKSDTIIYTVTPSCNGIADVWGKENDFDKPLVEGSWQDVVNFFNKD